MVCHQERPLWGRASLERAKREGSILGRTARAKTKILALWAAWNLGRGLASFWSMRTAPLVTSAPLPGCWGFRGNRPGRRSQRVGCPPGKEELWDFKALGKGRGRSLSVAWRGATSLPGEQPRACGRLTVTLYARLQSLTAHSRRRWSRPDRAGGFAYHALPGASNLLLELLSYLL